MGGVGLKEEFTFSFRYVVFEVGEFWGRDFR